MPESENSIHRRIWSRSFSLSLRSSRKLKDAEIDHHRGDSVCDSSTGIVRGSEEDDDAELNGVVGVDGDGASSPQSRWAGMLPEILGQIIQRVDATGNKCPLRRNVVACGCVCTGWRVVTQDVVASCSTQHAGAAKITFPLCLKKPGPRDIPRQCLIKRDKKSGTFYLHLSLAPSTFTDKGKFLLAARRNGKGIHTEYIISLDAEDFSQGSNAYVGKLRSDFLGTNFTIYDSHPQRNGAKPSSNKAGRRFACNQISPQVPAGYFEIGEVSYKYNLLKSRTPRRMEYTLRCPWSVETTSDDVEGSKAEQYPSTVYRNTVLRNKAPRWHEQLQCWCLDFHGRATVPSVKNFQLVASMDQSQEQPGDEETVLLQFGKVVDDNFTMDYRQPLSAFQAFAICLSRDCLTSTV